MFGLFDSKKEIKVTDLVWKNDAAKYKGIASSLDPKKKMVFLYYFIETKNHIKQLLDAAQLSYSPDIRTENNTITQADNILNSITDLTDRTICFIEHHPSFRTEQKILQHLQEDLNVKNVSFHISLEEPLFIYFGAGQIIDMLEKLGMSDDEALQHTLISKAIVNAQKKIDEKTPNAIETSSAKNWFEVNLPPPSS